MQNPEINQYFTKACIGISKAHLFFLFAKVQDYVAKVCIYFSYKSSGLSLFINREVEVGFWTFYIYNTNVYNTDSVPKSWNSTCSTFELILYICCTESISESSNTLRMRYFADKYLPNWFTKNSVFSLSGFWLSGAQFVPLIFRQVQMYLLAIFAIPSVWCKE